MNSPIAISLDERAAARDADSLLLVPSLERRRLQCYAGLVLADIAALLSGFWLAGYAYLGPVAGGAAFLLAQVVLPIYLTVALYNGAYSIDALSPSYSLRGFEGLAELA